MIQMVLLLHNLTASAAMPDQSTTICSISDLAEPQQRATGFSAFLALFGVTVIAISIAHIASGPRAIIVSVAMTR
ncbi:MAG: hypothetical protein NVSMB60_30970 [Mycobacterium sp.]